MPWASLSSRAIAGVVGFCALCAPSTADIIYVDANLTTGANDGTSWADAYRGETALFTATLASTFGDQIWVADGRYIPGTSRAHAFTVRNGVGVFGGFAGGETQLLQRNPELNLCVLSGDLNNDDEPFPSTAGWSDNAYHVVEISANSSSTTLDGFTITHGYANGPTATHKDRGGGVFCVSGQPSLRNLRVVHNRAELAGGGVYVRSALPSLTDCRVESNAAGIFGGGAVVVSSAVPTWNRCFFADNVARRGGGVDISGVAQPNFTNCIFTRNTATGTASEGGGGAYVGSNSVAYFFNSTLYANSADATAGGVQTVGSSSRLANCIVFLNVGAGGDTQGGQLGGSIYAVSYSCVQHGYPGFANISANPLLADPTNGDFSPTTGSPVIDIGTNPGVPLGVLVDFDRNPRFVDDPKTPDGGLGKAPIVDMGALEYQPVEPVCPQIVQDPQSQTYCRRFDVLLTLTTGGPTPSGYQWRKDGVDLPGETLDQLAIPNIGNADEGAYTVVAFATDCSPVESGAAVVVVCATDANCDTTINSTDVVVFINWWLLDLPDGTLFTDFDDNGIVNSTDVSEFINVWFEEVAGGCAG